MYISPITPQLYEVFGEPKKGTFVYKQTGDFEAAQGWFRALNRVVGEVIPLSSVSLYVPVSRNSVHKRIKEGKLSCFKFQVKDDSPEVSKSLNTDRPHAFVPVMECLSWYKESRDRSTIKAGMVPEKVAAHDEYQILSRHRFDVLSRKHENAWKEPYDKFQQHYIAKTHERALANLTPEERTKYEP
jgi:hypothetical protein